MEDVLSVYARSYDARRPVVCMDEKPLQLFASSRKGFRSRDGKTEYEDCEYVRHGTASIFLFTEPLAGWRMADAQEPGCSAPEAPRIILQTEYMALGVFPVLQIPMFVG